MSFKSDFNDFVRSKEAERNRKPERIPEPRRNYGVGNHYKLPKGKPNLFDPNAKSGPVKIYTKEEIAAYEQELREKGLI